MRLARTGTLLVVALSGACAAKPFTYHPRPAPAEGPRSPARIAVLPFADGTAERTTRVVYGEENRHDLAHKGYADLVGALPPELWARAFADEAAASGRFRAVRFTSGREEAGDADVLVDGTLLGAYVPGEWADALRASRRAGGRVLWTRRSSRAWASVDMSVVHERLLETMRDMFEEAGADLARALATPAGKAAPTSPVERAIQVVLEGGEARAGEGGARRRTSRPEPARITEVFSETGRGRAPPSTGNH